MTITKPIARFRLYPEAPRGLYVLVNVWPNKDALVENCLCAEKSDHEGCCTEVYVTDYGKARARTKPICAVVNLHRDLLTMGVVTHELFHATMAWGRRIGFNFSRLGADDAVNDDEERLTYAHSELCRKFMVRAIGAGLYG